MLTFRIISMFFVLSGFICAVIILLDLRKHRQPMRIMEAVWPLTGLWGNWPALWAYYAFGRNTAPHKRQDKQAMPFMDMPDKNLQETDMHGMKMPGTDMPAMPRHSRFQQTALSTLHCGAGCTLADLLGEWFTFFIPVYIGGSVLAGQWTLDYLLALVIGVFFQYAAIQSMEHLPVIRGLGKALKADFLSLTAWQAGMYGWMAIFMFGIWEGQPLLKTNWEFWFMMQIAMFAGFLVSYPVNRLLIKAGIKHGM